MHLILQNKEGKFANTKLENGIIIPGFTSNITNYVKDIKFISHKRRRKKFCLYCKSQTNGLMLIVCVYIILFSIASVILVMSVLRLQRLNVSEDNHNSLHHEVNYNMNNFEFKEIKNLLSKRLYKEFRWPFKSSVFNCSNLSYVKKFKYLTSGWTKNVFSFEYSGKNYALKSVNINGMDMQNCMKNYTKKACFEKASLKMYKEYVLSRELFHTNIMKVRYL